MPLSMVKKRNEAGADATALECNRICEMGHLRLDRPLAGIPSLFLVALLLLGGSILPPAAAQAGNPQKDRAEELAFEASRYWDRNDYAGAVAKFRESIALDPKGETYRNLGDLYAEQDMHSDAIAAYQAAIAADPLLEPELRVPLGKQMLWGDRAKDAVPFLVSALADHPDDVEAQRYLALAYRWSDRLKESEAIYRKILAGNPWDLDARKGLATALLWQGRFLAASDEFGRVLGSSPADAEALTGLSRAQLFLDMPEDSGLSVARAEQAAPRDQEVRDQIERVRERLARYAVLEVRGSHDSDDLSLYEVTLSAHDRPVKGLDLDGAVRQRFFRQGSPGKQQNIGKEDSADGTGGSLSLSFRRAPSIGWHGSVGYDRYDLGGFHPWSGRFGLSVMPADTVRLAFDWEHGHFDTLLSFQNKVTFDEVSFSVSKHFRWRTEMIASAALLYHHNENETGQSRENRGERFALDLSRLLYLKGETIYVGGLLRFTWLSFSEDLDVGVYDPERYTTQEAGLDGRWRFRPLWEFHGTVTGGIQQEKGAKSGPTYSADLGLDRKIGRGLVTFGAFASDSNALGQGEGYHRYGGLLRFRIPF
jgi:tetratricopeptide (TPR) repeat protein